MDHGPDLAKLGDSQLAELLRGPETAFPPDLWGAILRERDRRLALQRIEAATRRSEKTPDRFPDISAWAAVASTMKAASNTDDVYEAIGRVLAADPIFQPFRQDGYPLDLCVQFPGALARADHESINATEMIWVRTVAVGATPNHWIGRLLNDPHFFVGSKDSYVEFRADGTGLRFVRVVKA